MSHTGNDYFSLLSLKMNVHNIQDIESWIHLVLPTIFSFWVHFCIINSDMVKTAIVVYLGMYLSHTRIRYNQLIFIMFFHTTNNNNNKTTWWDTKFCKSITFKILVRHGLLKYKLRFLNGHRASFVPHLNASLTLWHLLENFNNLSKLSVLNT